MQIYEQGWNWQADKEEYDHLKLKFLKNSGHHSQSVGSLGSWGVLQLGMKGFSWVVCTRSDLVSYYNSQAGTML